MHEIEFKQDAKPIKQHPYPLAPKYLPFVKETVDMLLATGFITRSTSPSQVPITIAAKDGGKDYRFCIDYRAVNAQLISASKVERTASKQQRQANTMAIRKRLILR